MFCYGIIFTYLSPVNVYVNKVKETDICDVFKGVISTKICFFCQIWFFLDSHVSFYEESHGNIFFCSLVCQNVLNLLFIISTIHALP